MARESSLRPVGPSAAVEALGARRPAAKPAREWTAQQRDAIESLGSSLLVSAAAGSGKTAVLTERCVRLVCEQPRCNVSNLLVVTFTEAAAQEMKSRIEQALRARLEAEPDDAHLRRQVALLEHIHCSTLHSFCNRLLRQHFHRLGLDPDFRVLDADESALLRVELAANLFEESYDCADAAAFQGFVDCYGDGNDQRLMTLVIQTHNLLCSLVDPMGWMEQARARLAEAASQPLDRSQLGLAYLAILRAHLEDLRRDTRSAIEAISRLKDFRAYGQYLEGLESILADWSSALASRGYDGLVGAVRGTELPRLPSIRNSVAGKEAAHLLVTSVQKQFKEGPLIQSLRFSSTEFQDGLRSVLPHARVFLDLLAGFAWRYRKEKDALRALDFNDLERFTLRLLSAQRRASGGALAPSPVARLLHRQFHHVLVDEYQDINEVQDAILALASRECLPRSEASAGNLFAVGDVKQSIYRFRLADPQRFLDRAARYRQADAPGRVIDLQANFRSRKPLLDALNGVFERLMVGGATEIAYDRSHRLEAGAQFPLVEGAPCFSGAPIELHFLPARLEAAEGEESESDPIELERTEREAVLVSRRIGEMLGQHGPPRMHVAERLADGSSRLRPIEYRDIVILLRATRYHADRYAEILRQRGIPVYNTGGTGYFDSTEIQEVLCLLRLLDNQRQDIPLAAVLRSPLANLPGADEALARIRLAYPYGPARRGSPPVRFHAAVEAYAKEKDDALAAALRDFLAAVARWREVARHRPVAELLWTIYEDTGLLAYCGGLENGQQRCANLIQLYERARQFGAFSRQGLYRFIRFLESLREETDPAPPSQLSEAENVVRIMSIHKAKGLEFPVVFLPNLGKRINFTGCTGGILADRQLGLALVAVDEARQIRYPSLASILVSDRLRRQTLAEELRILYVAMTRAREHLVMIGTGQADAPEAWARRYDRHSGALPANVILGAGTMLDWVGPVAASLSATDPPWIQIYDHPSEEVQSWLAPTASEAGPRLAAELAELRPLQPAPGDDAVAAQVVAGLMFRYPHQAFCGLKAHVSVSELAKHDAPAPTGVEREATSPAELRLPQCVQARQLTPTERGNIVHLFLQHMDFASISAADLGRQLDALVDKRLLTAAQAKAVDLDRVRWFLGTELGRHLQRNSARLVRELAINYPLPPALFDAPASADPMDRVMLRGRIDLLLPEEDGLVLIDFKSDAISAQRVAQRTAQYRPQMELYAEAIARITSRPVKAAHLVFFGPRQVVTL